MQAGLKESIDFVKSKLFNKNAYIYDLLDRSFIQNLVNQHISGEQNRRLLVWSLIISKNILVLI